MKLKALLLIIVLSIAVFSNCYKSNTKHSLFTIKMEFKKGISTVEIIELPSESTFYILADEEGDYLLKYSAALNGGVVKKDVVKFEVIKKETITNFKESQ